jgi:hypothetical protein
VYQSELTLGGLTKLIHEVLSGESPVVPTPSRREYKKVEEVLLKATGARNWNDLVRQGSNYSLEFSASGTRLDFSRVDEEERWQDDPEKTRVLPVGTPLSEVATIILADLQSRGDYPVDPPHSTKKDGDC